MTSLPSLTRRHAAGAVENIECIVLDIMYIYVEVPILSIPYDEFVPILKSASRPHSSTMPLPTLASSNLGALPLVGWAPRSAANGPLRVPSSRESRRNKSECASLKRNQAPTGCPHVFLPANSTRGGHREKPSATRQQSPPPHASTSRSARASVAKHKQQKIVAHKASSSDQRD